MQSENLFLSKYIEIPMSPYLLFIFHALTVRSNFDQGQEFRQNKCLYQIFYY